MRGIGDGDERRHARRVAVGRRRHRRRPVMSEINVTPMVDVMLVLLIIFMVSAPLLTVGVPIDLPQTQAKTPRPGQGAAHDLGQHQGQGLPAEYRDQDRRTGAQAARPSREARGGTDERIYVRGDKKVDYGTVMKVMGRLSAAGFRRVALVTEVEQGSGADD